MTPEFLLTTLVVCLTPGVGVIYTLAVALRGGARAGPLAALGCTICTALHLGLAVAGLAAILHTSALLFQAVKFAGVAYLLWLAWSTLRGGGALDIRAAEPGSAVRIVWRGVLLNPKLPVFFLAFLPQFIPADAVAAGAKIVELGLAFAAMTFLTFALYALAAGWMRAAVVGSPGATPWLRRAFSASFAGLGARLALERA